MHGSARHRAGTRSAADDDHDPDDEKPHHGPRHALTVRPVWHDPAAATVVCGGTAPSEASLPERARNTGERLCHTQAHSVPPRRRRREQDRPRWPL
jgi:hypothetical protein